jgi:hypothetical protein
MEEKLRHLKVSSATAPVNFRVAPFISPAGTTRSSDLILRHHAQGVTEFTGGEDLCYERCLVWAWLPC